MSAYGRRAVAQRVVGTYRTASAASPIAAAALSHPNVLTIFDVAIGEPAYLVTELLEGDTLRALLNRGPLLWSRTSEIVLQLLDGLAAAHARGIVHRDLKPDNVFLTRDNVVKILDFGLAKLVVPVSEDDVTRANVTIPGVLLGTLAYMAPEQLRGHAADARSDLFAVGAIMFELLTGERAFCGGSQAETLSAVLRERPELPHHIGAGSSRSVARIIDRCLAKDPDHRFQSARDLRFALELIGDVPSTTRVGEEPAGEKSVAVLPFANMNTDPESQYFSCRKPVAGSRFTRAARALFAVGPDDAGPTIATLKPPLRC